MTAAVCQDLILEGFSPIFADGRRSRKPGQQLIGSIGSDHFGEELTRFLHESCEADYVHVFRISQGQPLTMLSRSIDGSDAAKSLTAEYGHRKMWHRDPSMARVAEVGADSKMCLKADARPAVSDELRSLWFEANVCERTMLCGPSSYGVLGVSISRSVASPRELSDEAQIEVLTNLAFPSIERHFYICDRNQRLLQAFTSLPEIEANLAGMSKRLSPRLMQVAARLIFGLSATDIATNLSISGETVVSHRKRLYELLSIAHHRELLLWYLNLAAM